MGEKIFSVRRFLPKSLLGRSLLILVIPVVLIQVVTAAVFVDRHWEKITGRLSYAAAGEIAVLADAIDTDVDDSKLRGVLESVNLHLGLNVEFKRGELIPGQISKRPLAPFEAMFYDSLLQKLQDQIGRPFVLDLNFKDKQVAVYVQLNDGVLLASLPERRLYSSSGYVFLLWVSGASLLLLLISVLFMRNQIRPIRKLAAAARRFGQGRDVPMFKPEGAREVRDAARSFMDMHHRIKRQIEQRTTMLAGVSHDLRTPLTRMRLQLEMLDPCADIDSMKEDIKIMETMIDGYLDFVREEKEEQSVVTDLNALFLQVLSRVSSYSDVKMFADVAQNISAVIKPQAFERCIVNVLQNAAKHSDSVWLQVVINNDRELCVIIEDNGPGIPEENYGDVFKPFFRIDAARRVDDGGVGLGLPIAMDIVHAHGGEIMLSRSKAHGGLCVEIKIPL